MGKCAETCRKLWNKKERFGILKKENLLPNEK